MEEKADYERRVERENGFRRRGRVEKRLESAKKGFREKKKRLKKVMIK